MLRIDGPEFPALGLAPIRECGHVVAEQDSVSPFLELFLGSDGLFGRSVNLNGVHGVRLPFRGVHRFHAAVANDGNVQPRVPAVVKDGEQIDEHFAGLCVPFPIADAFNGGDFPILGGGIVVLDDLSGAHVPQTVSCVDNECFVRQTSVPGFLVNCLQGFQHGAVVVYLDAVHIHVLGSFFRVQEKGSRQPGRQRGFPHAFRPVDDDPLGALLHPALDIV